MLRHQDSQLGTITKLALTNSERERESQLQGVTAVLSLFTKYDVSYELKSYSLQLNFYLTNRINHVAKFYTKTQFEDSGFQ